MRPGDIVEFTYPWLPDVRRSLPEGWPSSPLATAQSFEQAQELARDGEIAPRIVSIKEIADFEAWLVRVRSVSNCDWGELGLALAKLTPQHFVRPPDACAWLYNEVLAGKPWAQVRDSDPANPAPTKARRDTNDASAALERAPSR
jgi:hypothetical protein